MTQPLEHLAGQVVIVGGGIAGMVAALALAPRPVVLLTRAGAGAETSSAWAQGGIAASLGADDSPQLHCADTLAAGDGLCDPAVAAMVTAGAHAAIAMLQGCGVRFDTAADGGLALGLEAAHGRRRIVHAAGSGSGAAIVAVLVEALGRTPSVTLLTDITARRLVTDVSGAIAGVLCATADGPAMLPTSRVLLATGGAGGLYDATTSPPGNYGQGIALAARAGAALCDMEFMQFHPTALDSGRYPLALVSEAVRGEGAVLLNDRGERFLANEPGAELAARDVVARAIHTERAGGGRVWLDARTSPGGRFATLFPNIAQLCADAGFNPATDPVPVRPAAHYHMGGVASDMRGRSTVCGLWVAGEVACTGLHGANRLASNSLLEAVVMAMRAADDISAQPAAIATACGPVPVLPPEADLSAVRPVVSQHLGVLRHEAGLRAAAAQLLPQVCGNDAGAGAGIDAGHDACDEAASDPAIVALAMAVFATLRQESRGAHARTDFPARNAAATRRTMTLSGVLAAARAMTEHPVELSPERPVARSACA